MDPYALGLLLGDGCMTGATTPSFTTDRSGARRGARRLLSRAWSRSRRTASTTCSSRDRRRGEVITLANPVTAVLRDLGLAGTRSATKFVPDATT